MSVKVKICGLRTPESLAAALDAGADYFGLVFYPASPRNVDFFCARALADQGRGRAKSVALLVDPDDAAVKRIADEVAPDLIQLHGGETPGRLREIKALTGRQIIKAIKVESAADAAAARDYEGAADLILYDAKEPEDAGRTLPGGNGVPFDWPVLMGVKGKGSFMLSGGLDADNVAAAIAATGAAAVDVSSGVESAPGEKDAELIRRFIAAAKSPG
ncbi:MAG: phosphoribosylanthranilate isomerase [Proteobacteria bacterium]|nr:phosphoribosylanthranilate isomerase [Pseudomonadota bacterium]